MSREMKHSGIDWIGEIPEGWDVVKIGFLFENLDSLRKPISAEQRERNNPQYDYYGASGIIDKIDYFNVDDEVLLIGEDGANLVMRNLPLVYKAKGRFWVNNHAHILKPICCDYNFMSHVLEATDYRNYITGSAQPKLSQENLQSIKLPVPPLSEQQKIADYLDKVCGEIDGLVALKEAMIDELKAYKQSLITEAVTRGLNPNVPLKPSGIDWIGDIPEGWEVKPFKVLFRTGKGLSFTKSDLVEKGISVISYGQIHSKQNRGTGIISSLIRCIPEDIVQGCNSSKVSVGDFIFADTSEDLSGCGNCVYVDKDINLYAGYHSVTAISKRKVSNIYLAYLFLTDCWRSQIRGRVSGIKVYSISQSIINQTSVILPPEGEQQQIANYLDTKCSEIDSLIAIKQQKIEELKEYKKSVIYEYVTGKKEVV